MGKPSRDKGKRGERATVNEIKAALGPDVVVRCGNQTRQGRDEPDVVVEGMPVWIEVKTWGTRPSWGQMVAALEQAEKAALESSTPNATPIAVIREDRRPPLAMVRTRLAGPSGVVVGYWPVVAQWLAVLDTWRQR